MKSHLCGDKCSVQPLYYIFLPVGFFPVRNVIRKKNNNNCMLIECVVGIWNRQTFCSLWVVKCSRYVILVQHVIRRHTWPITKAVLHGWHQKCLKVSLLVSETESTLKSSILYTQIIFYTFSQKQQIRHNIYLCNFL